MNRIKRRIRILSLLVRQREAMLNKLAVTLSEEQVFFSKSKKTLLDLEKKILKFRRQFHVADSEELNPEQMINNYKFFHELKDQSSKFVEQCEKSKKMITDLEHELNQHNKKKKKLEEKLEKAECEFKRNIVAFESRSIEDLYLSRLAGER